MKKRLLGLVILVIIAVLALVGCDKIFTSVEPEQYAVSFDVDGGSYIAPIKVDNGGFATKPEDPTKEGFDFAGWYKDAARTEEWIFTTHKITANTTIYAKWVDHVHTGGAATCTESAVCSVCGESYGEPLDHTVVTDEAVAPTCGKDGLTEGSHCSVCGEVIVKQEAAPATGNHTWGEWVTDKEATETEDGAKHRDCSVCGKTEEGTIPSLNHTHSYESAVTTAPGCETKGVKTFTCGCGNSYTEEIPATGHAYDEGVETTAPGCETKGVKTFTCGCGDSYTEEIPATGHDYDNGVETTAATYGHKGVKTFTCGNDASHTYTEEIAQLPLGDNATAEQIVNAAYSLEKDEALIGTFTLTGVITEVDYTYNSYYNNITVTIKVVGADETKSIQCYKLVGENIDKITKTDTITVTGPIKNYNGTVEFDQATLVSYTEHTHAWSEATCKVLATCSVCGKTTGEYADHSYNAEGVCTVCGHDKNSTEAWVLVTDIAQLKDGAEIVIVAAGYNVALSTTQRNNNRGETNVAKNENTVTINSDVQIIVLGITEDGKYTFFVTGSKKDDVAIDDGYLYAASSSSNHLKTQKTNDANGTWTIEISEAGIATVKAQGSSTRNWLRYNDSTSYGLLFSCYGSGQKDISIYVKTTVTAHTCTPAEAVKENEAAPTCTAAGSYDSVVYCSECEKEISRETVTVDALGHNVGEYVQTKAPTCTAKGEERSDCSRCNHYETRELDKVAHKEEVVPGKAATCTEAGLKDGKKCSVCGATLLAQEVIPATNHDWDEGTVTTEPTCETTGIRTHTCKNDATHKKTEEIAANGHSDKNDDNVCDVCEDPVCGKDDHKYVGVKTKAPTCTAVGTMTYTCSACNDSYTEDIAIDKDAHEYDEGVVTTEPTCSAEGEKTYTCKHNSEHKKTEDVAINKDAHSWNEGVVTTEPTCSATGVKTYTCKHNSEHKKTEDVAINKDAHSWNEGVVTTEPTCSAEGVKTFTCQHDAAHTYTVKVDIDEDAHTYVDGYCTNKGENGTCGAVDPDHYFEKSISEVLSGTVGEKVKISGVICEIYQKYSSKYGNISFYLTDGTAKVIIFQIPAENENTYTIGDSVTISGVIGEFYSVKQIAAGATGVNKGKTDKYTVTFNSNGGTPVESTEVYKYCTLTAPNAPTKDSDDTCAYTFAGWYLGENAYDFSTPLTSDIELVAKWQETVLPPAGTIQNEYHYTLPVGDKDSSKVTEESVKIFDENTTIRYNNSYYTSQLRIYGKQDGGYLIIESKESIWSVTINAGYKDNGLVVEVSKDGITYEKYTTWTTTAAYKDFTEVFASNEYKYLRFSTTKDSQVRITSISLITLSFPTQHTHTGEKVDGQAATCTENGWKDYYQCSDEDCAKLFADEACTEEITDLEAWKTGEGKVDAKNHDWSNWTPVEGGKHTRTCENDSNHVETEDCYDSETDTDHNCDTCETKLSECSDSETDADHKCDTCGEEVSGHSYTPSVTAPTCTAEGYTTYTCNCGGYYIGDKTEKAAHTEGDWITDSDATCTKDGSKHQICSVCKETIKTEAIPAKNHSYGEASYAWSEDGKSCTATRVCENDETHIDTATATITSTVKAPATCEDMGTTTYTATFDAVWADTQTKDVEDIAAKGHSTVYHDAKAATCTEIGWNEYKTCENCDYTTYVEIPALGHRLENWVALAPTCTEAGYTAHQRCSREGCDYASAYFVIAPKGHVTVVDAAVAATCTATGLKEGSHCSACNEILVAQTVVDALGHKDEDDNNVCDVCEVAICGENDHKYVGVETKAPTCTAVGTMTYTCSACNDSYTETIDALNHDMVEVEGKAATCTEDGYTAYTDCSRCDYIEGKEVIEAKGHSFTSYVSNNDATCTADGTKTAECDRCDKTDTVTDEGSKLGHNYETPGYYVVVDGVLKIAHNCANDDSHVTYEETVVDTTSPVTVANEADLKTVLGAGYSVKLVANINLTETIEIVGKTLTIDLADYTILADWESTGVVEVFHIHDGSNVTINSGENGALKSGNQGGTNSVVSCRIDSTLIINGGYYYSANIGDVIFCETRSTVYINGGVFETAAAWNDLWYVLDIDEGEDEETRGRYVVKGGTFVSFDPANHTNDGDYTNKVAEGYHSIKNGESYVVSEHSYSETLTVGDNTHWYECECGAKKDEAKHTDVDTDTDHSCDECGKKSVTAHTDGDDDNHLCDNGCGQVADDGCHSGTATCTEKAICKECGQEYGEKNAENHSSTELVYAYTGSEGTHTHKATYKCCGATHTESADCVAGENSHNCATCDKELSECADDSKDHNCDTCGEKVSECIDSNDDDKCDICGERMPVEKTSTLDFDASKANRVSFSTTSQVWSVNGITFTNNKSSSTTSVADYSDPVRLYKNSEIVIKAKGIRKIVFNCDSETYATALGNSIGDTATVNDKVVTVSFSSTIDSYTITLSGGQVRLDSIVVTTLTEAPTLKSITAEGMNATYTVGDEVSLEGLIVKAILSDGTTETLGEGDYTVDTSAVNSAAAGTYKIYISYNDGFDTRTTEIEITYISAYVVSIEVSGMKTEYYVGATLDTNATLTATYNDNSTAEIIGYTINTDEVNMSVAGTYEVIFTFGEVSATVEVTVNELPAANSAITITQALEIGAAHEHNTYTEGKYYITGIITEIYNTTYGNMYIVDKDGNQLTIYGSYSADGSTRYDAMTYPHKVGQTVTVYGIVGQYNGTVQVKNGCVTIIHECEYSDATCEAPATCSVCGATNGNALDHLDENKDHACDRTGCTAKVGEHVDADGDTVCDYGCSEAISGDTPAEPVIKEITFNLGENGSASHSDGSSATTYSETVDDYTLSITGGTKMYTGARDATGNSCIKFGTSSAVGSMTFTVADNVNTVVIYVGKYKTNTTKVTINGTTHTISGASNSGAYDAIEIDTSINKTVTFATVSGGVRAMINTIVFKATE